MGESERNLCEKVMECEGGDELCFERKAKVLRNILGVGNKQQTGTKKIFVAVCGD
jgi:hypothetical protein